MQPIPTRSDGIFSPFLNAELEARGVREAFSWGPQALLLLCGLAWLVLALFREDLLGGRAIVTSVASAAAVLAALAVIQILRRRRRRATLVPMHGQLAVYSDGAFQYSFSPSEAKKHPTELHYLLHTAVPMLLLVLLTAFFVWDSWRDPHVEERLVFAYLFMYACFGLVAAVRTQLILVWYWIPEGSGTAKRCAGFSRKSARVLRAA